MEGMKAQIEGMLQGIKRYTPENIMTLEHYLDLQSREKGYNRQKKTPQQRTKLLLQKLLNTTISF